jgi:HSP20 family protein
MEWNIFDEMQKMQEEMDKIFSTFFSSSYQLGPGRVMSEVESEHSQHIPGTRKALVDVQETDRDVIVTAELPGMKKEDIELNVTSERVEIKAQTREETTREEEGFTAYARRYAGFYRAILLPTPVKSEDAKTTYKNGVLEIILPKKENITSGDTTSDIKIN